MALDAGSRIAQYRLERKLGAGGMGEVYLARDEKLDRLVAIKLLTAGDDGARRRLAREARAAASLDHPGICAVYEVGNDAVVGDFIAMQYIEGETLASRLRLGRMSPDEAMAIGAQIAEALIAAHRHGLVHRDLKPQNIIITPSGSARLLDFGLALHVPTTLEAANAITSSRVTDPNMVLGTPSYMSPEQVRNETADFRSDVFSLGCVLYECLTGHRAFTGATTAEVLGAILHVDPPPVSSRAPNLGPAYDAMCGRMLDKIPAERFQSAEEVLGAIRALTPSRQFSTKPLALAPRRRRRWLWQIAAAAVILFAAVYSWRWFQGAALPAPSKEAKDWYDRGAEFMRDGVYANARDAFREATNKFPAYAQAHARLAEAFIALDDERGASDEALRAASLVPNRSRLDPDDALRYDAARESAIRNYENAIAAYQELVNRQPQDAGRWLDLGRAQELASRRPEALGSYEKARDLNQSYAAAHLRIAVLEARAGKTDDALGAFEEAIRLYRAAGQMEGQAEALLRKGIALSSLTRTGPAREALDQVMKFAADSKYASQRIRAQFELARLAYLDGTFDTAEALAKQALADADAADVPTLAAAGLIDLGNALLGSRRYPEADHQFGEAVRLASSREARRTAMRAKLSQASARLQMERPQDTLSLCEEPMRYFAQTNDTRLENSAKALASRAHEQLDQYTDAERLAKEVLVFAEASKDNGLISTALDNLAGQLSGQGRWPEALPLRERLDKIDSNANLPRDLANHAELLILLGRADEAEALIRRISQGIADGVRAYVDLRSRVAELYILRATTERRFADVIKFASTIGTVPADRDRSIGVLVERARAGLKVPGKSSDAIFAWPAQAKTPSEHRQLTYWAAQTLVERGEAKRAFDMVTSALHESACAANPELAWRLAALGSTAAASTGLPTQNDLRQLISTKMAELKVGAWAPAAATYFARPDLTALARSIR